MTLLGSIEHWLRQWGVTHAEAAREAVSLLEHITATTDANSASGFYALVCLRQRRERAAAAMRQRRLEAKERDIQI